MLLKVGSKGDTVRRLQQGLGFLGYLPSEQLDGDFGSQTENAVKAFQQDHDLYVDGMVGPMTMRRYNQILSTTPYVFEAPSETPEPTKIKQDRCLVTVLTDKVEGSAGYKAMVIRDDVAKAFNKLIHDVHLLGGKITTSGGKRSLNSPPGPNRKALSLHYLGLAFDLAPDTGMQDPTKDQYLMEPDPDEQHWTVWCRSTLTSDDLKAAVGFAGVDGGQKTFKSSVTVTVFNFTQLAAKYGFECVSSEWWHFEHSRDLKVGVSTFGRELLRIYTLDQIKAALPHWDVVKNCIYGEDWQSPSAATTQS